MVQAMIFFIILFAFFSVCLKHLNKKIKNTNLRLLYEEEEFYCFYDWVILFNQWDIIKAKGEKVRTVALK